MKLIETTYRTLNGSKKIIQLPTKKTTQWVVYENDIPKYFVDLFDLSIESNAMMNSLVLCSKRSMRDTLKLINKRNNINLSINKITRLGFPKKKDSKIINIDLKPLPENWLAYSL